MSNSHKDRFRRLIEARKQRGEHYMTEEKYRAQMEFYKQASSAPVPTSDNKDKN